MVRKFTAILAASALAYAAPLTAAEGPSDAEIAHIAYTAGNIDVAAAKQALAKSRNAQVREFASTMVRDHDAVNAKALELLSALKVTPRDNPTSQALKQGADATMAKLSRLQGAAFDKAYAENEAAFHKTVNGALESTLIPSANNEKLKSLLESGLALFREHQAHAEQLGSQLD